MKKWLIAAFAGLIGVSGSLWAQQGDAAAGKQAATACAACHGVDGNSPNPEWPDLAGQHPTYLFNQLQAFKAGVRENPLMTPQAQGLSEEQMRNISLYFAQQVMKVDAASEELVELGERIYRAGLPEKGVPACTACHGPAGDGVAAAAFPKLGGQNAPYVAKQLLAYRAGERTTDLNAMMRGVVANMTDEEIQAVASYVSGLYRGPKAE